MDKHIKAVIEMLISRAEVGDKKYGVNLERTDFDQLTWLTMLQEELLDGSNYIEVLKDRERNRMQMVENGLKFKRVQIFNLYDMSGDLPQRLSNVLEFSNDTYQRYYPNGIHKRPLDGELIDWLTANGMENNNEGDFYVLIYIGR